MSERCGRCANHKVRIRDAMGVGWAVFRNYVGHAKEIYGDITDYPRFFLMPPSAMIEADEDGTNIVTLLAPEEHIDYEVEMVTRLGDDLEPSEMCVGIDTTNRTRQGLAKKKGWPWLEGKGFRGSGVLGTWSPWDDRAVEIGLSLNGEVKQQASTELMVHSVDSIMRHLREWYDLSPGDFVWTGTPKGVGPMNTGDVIRAWMKNSDGEMISVLNAVCE
ncbi:MAG: fumarylacetoacetate hydrolase family protein [Candidatus Thalassarchaeaceae archaeon]|nr:isomerase/hydrolase [Euryarchaeota archaeon]MDP7257004.1 fumarylacetoacetate hydrolase family protein [Candidatus Thalassarchaeaceae archaeon]HJL55001.1 fumarylacetoacetate hydrolase family protein [Candidatus Thalassarchaeaceae archaeon]HJO84239.1 fumarylacetoacetate hydrolase family protein [Candidatus Thalassarchaeaceae archaeon]